MPVCTMTTKTLTITEDAYNLLANQKKKTESFSETIQRLLSGKTRISDLAGAWKDMTKEDVDNLQKDIQTQRAASIPSIR